VGGLRRATALRRLAATSSPRALSRLLSSRRSRREPRRRRRGRRPWPHGMLSRAPVCMVSCCQRLPRKKAYRCGLSCALLLLLVFTFALVLGAGCRAVPQPAVWRLPSPNHCTYVCCPGSPPCPPLPSALPPPCVNPAIPPLPALPILQMMPPLRTLWGIDQVAPRQDGAGREGRCHSRSELEAICSELR